MMSILLIWSSLILIVPAKVIVDALLDFRSSLADGQISVKALFRSSQVLQAAPITQEIVSLAVRAA
jgi:hypothetical protein